MNPRTLPALAGTLLAGTLMLTSCSGADPLSQASGDSTDGAGEKPTIVVGSQDYYSNEIIAEVYAQALETHGYTVERQFRIGQREVYLPEIESGEIDLFPEYTGPLLQYWKPDTTARLTEDVYAELAGTVPEGLRVLDQSSATDQDSYVVTRAFAETWDLTGIGDLADVTEPLTLGGNSEGETRPNGPRGLQEAYDVDVDFTPIEDGGGPLTVKALRDNSIQLAIVYTADPSIAANDLVSLEDPAGLFLASHVVPLASDDVDEAAAEIINEVDAALTPEGLIALNARSVQEQAPAGAIAAAWLAEQDLF
ncbi:ABC transporter substrate-binding protein [Kocuria sp. CPCC 205258]|uniref:ABC transporter substrate-binding protein n=1 Tax=Kocuria sp. CPCC 205258 TaxID=3073552 RepID=UPI0034D3F251